MLSGTDHCTLCGGSESTPMKYLLKCRQCSFCVHHRCCKPPIPDVIVVSIERGIQKALKRGKPVKGWLCPSCEKGGPTSAANHSKINGNGMEKMKDVTDLTIDDDDNNDNLLLTSVPQASNLQSKEKQMMRISSTTRQPSANNSLATRVQKKSHTYSPGDPTKVDFELLTSSDDDTSKANEVGFSVLRPTKSISSSSEVNLTNHGKGELPRIGSALTGDQHEQAKHQDQLPVQRSLLAKYAAKKSVRYAPDAVAYVDPERSSDDALRKSLPLNSPPRTCPSDSPNTTTNFQAYTSPLHALRPNIAISNSPQAATKITSISSKGGSPEPVSKSSGTVSATDQLQEQRQNITILNYRLFNDPPPFPKLQESSSSKRPRKLPQTTKVDKRNRSDSQLPFFFDIQNFAKLRIDEDVPGRVKRTSEIIREHLTNSSAPQPHPSRQTPRSLGMRAEHFPARSIKEEDDSDDAMDIDNLEFIRMR